MRVMTRAKDAWPRCPHCGGPLHTIRMTWEGEVRARPREGDARYCRLCWLGESAWSRATRAGLAELWRGIDGEDFANAHGFLPPALSIENAAPQHARYVNRDDDTAAMAEDGPYGDPPRYPLREPEVHVAEWPAVDTRDAFTRWLHEGRPDRYAALVALRELDGMMRDYGADAVRQQGLITQALVNLGLTEEVLRTSTAPMDDLYRALGVEDYQPPAPRESRPIPITRAHRGAEVIDDLDED